MNIKKINLTEFWEKIIIFSFVLCLLIVVQHAVNDILPKYKSQYDGLNLFLMYIHRFSTFVVPYFFILSGLLMFRDVEPSNIKRKLLSRIKSLVIPFLFWNFFWMLVMIILSLYHRLILYLQQLHIFNGLMRVFSMVYFIISIMLYFGLYLI